MAAPKGHPRWGGRKTGTLNKDKVSALEKAEALGVDPFVILLYFAAGDWKALGYEAKTKLVPTKEGVIEVDQIPSELRQKSAKDACEYVCPKLKAIEHSGPDGKSPFDSFAKMVERVISIKDADTEGA